MGSAELARSRLIRLSLLAAPNRAILLIFMQREGEPIMGGMSVPPGTDLDQAGRRLVVTEV